MIYLLYIFVFLMVFAFILLFYPYTVYFTGNHRRFFVMADLFITDIYFKKSSRKEEFYLKILGIFPMLKKKTVKKTGKKRKDYDPAYDRIYFIISFAVKHILSIFKILNIKKLGIQTIIGFHEYYLLSQLHVSSILLNNLLPDGIYLTIIPDYEKEVFEYEGKAEVTIYLWKIIWFFVKIIIHPATWSAVYEYYRYSKSGEDRNREK